MPDMSDGQRAILVEFSSQAGVRPVAVNVVGLDTLKEKSEQAIQQALAAIADIALRVSFLQNSLPSEFSKVEVEFGIKLDWEAGVLLSKAGGEANFNVKLTWEKAQVLSTSAEGTD